LPKISSTNFAPDILKIYLQQIEKVGCKVNLAEQGGALSYTLAFLDECVKPKVTWSHLKPHMENLVSHLLFPVLCQNGRRLSSCLPTNRQNTSTGN